MPTTNRPDPRTLRPGDRLWFKMRLRDVYGAHAVVAAVRPHARDIVEVDFTTANGQLLTWTAPLIRARFMGWR